MILAVRLEMDILPDLKDDAQFLSVQVDTQWSYPLG
jgi:hypothetical protein